MNPQLAQLRSAWALAHALKRTLVMPQFTCGMDRVWFPHDGVFPGSDPAFTIPFKPCPMDHVRADGSAAGRGVGRLLWRRGALTQACWRVSRAQILDTEAMERNGMLNGVREWSLLECAPPQLRAACAWQLPRSRC